jgi:hypothetical protein
MQFDCKFLQQIQHNRLLRLFKNVSIKAAGNYYFLMHIMIKKVFVEMSGRQRN